MSGPHILVVDDEADIRGLLKEILSEEGYEVDVAANAAQARASRARQTPDLVLLDIWMPDIDGISLLREWSSSATDGCPVVMMSGHGTVETAVEATRLGAFDFVEKPLSLAKLLRTVERALDAGKRRRQSGRLLVPPLMVPVGKSKVMQQLRAELQQIAANQSSVLLVGEPGSGREAFARYLHERGPRAGAAFLTLIASSLREADAEERLFGREEPGGAKRTGILEEAGEGTLFIHEVEDLPASVQRLLVGVLESGRFTRLGGVEPVGLRSRVLSAAQPGIENRAGTESFRRDLLAHLNMLIVRVPPLRDYAEDVPELLRHYVDRLVDTEGLPFRRFSVAAQNRLRNYPWPDNVRELKNLVHRLLIQGGPEEIRLEEIERELAVQAPPGEPLVKQDLLALPLREAREQFERAYLQQQLLLCNGKVGQLAKRVGMERTHLYRKLRSLGVDFRNISED
ncbi:MAG: sigma-54-dependent Fis family transcriptional regulator [Gammaproteobacteria bacterium]|nr:MAG: sigma-54-dependent Fis family transcriptional regulator [Gammaproteobacteria bacterium]TLY77702.1 MAG: sigma-54-dependent Fis family transcriptional regulator [Gammaproteobacteria bacterium]